MIIDKTTILNPALIESASIDKHDKNLVSVTMRSGTLIHSKKDTPDEATKLLNKVHAEMQQCASWCDARMLGNKCDCGEDIHKPWCAIEAGDECNCHE